MTPDVHPLMQDAHDLDRAVPGLPLEEQVRAHVVFEVAGTDLVSPPAPLPSAPQILAGCGDLADIAVRLLDAPVLRRVAPDPTQVLPSKKSNSWYRRKRHLVRPV